MATEKTLYTRLKLRYDSHENWTTNDPVLLAGEVALSTVSVKQDGTVNFVPSVLIKVGDGTHKYSELDFAYAKAADVLSACKSEDALKTFINGVIADAGIATSEAMEALAVRVTTAEGEIDTLQSEMDAVEKKAADNETAIGALEDLVGETKVSEQIAAAITALDLANTYDAKGAAAAVQTNLDTYKTSNDAAVLANTNNITANANAITAIKDGTTIDSFKDVEEALAGKETSGAAAQALADAKTYADGLAANYDAKGSAAQALTDAKAYADGLASNYDAAGAADQALVDAKAYTDAEIEEWVGDETVGVQISSAITELDLANTYAAKAHTHVKADITDFAHTHEISEVTGLQDALDGKETAGAAADALAEAKEYADGKDEAIAAAQAAADKAQEEVDALETYVGTIPDGYTESTVIAYINKKAEETLSSATGGSSESAASVLAALNTYKSENDPKVTANTEAIAALEDLVGDDKVSDQIADAVAVEKARAEAAEKVNADAIAVLNGNSSVEGSVDKKVADAINTFATQISDDDTVNTYKELIDYAASHGAEFTELVGEVDANTKAIATLNGDASTAGSVDKKIADAIAAENLAQYATDSDLSAVDTRLQTVEAAVGESGSIATDIADALAEAKKYTDDEVKELADGAVATNTADIAALDQLVGDTAVATQIANAITEALKIDGVDKYALATELAAAIARIAQNETDIAALESDKANDADLAAIAKTGNVNDLVQTDGDVIILDCGTSAE